MARKIDDHRKSVKRYLLRQLSDSEQESIELALLSDDDLLEELEIVEDELIDEYLADELSRDERLSFERDFLTNPERKRRLRSGEALRRFFDNASPRAVPTPTRFDRVIKWIRQAFLSQPGIVFASLLIVGVIGFGISRQLGFGIWPEESDVNKGLIALNAAYNQERPIEARISKLEYAPFITTRGGVPERVNSLERDRAARILLDAVRDSPGAASSHALGKYYLAQKDWDKAIQQFESALKSDSNNAQIYADLGAAYLEKGKIDLVARKVEPAGSSSGKGVEALGHSLEYLNKALTLNPNLPEPLFNRALCHQYLGLTAQAKADWLEYLKKDSTSQWANEARDHLKSIESQDKKSSQNREQILQEFLASYGSQDDKRALRVITNYQNRSGNVVVEQVLDSFLKAKQANNQPVVDRELSMLTKIGKLDFEKNGDRLYSDLATYYRSATPQQLAMLSQARSLMQKAHAGWGQVAADESLELFNESQKLFQQAGDLCEGRFAQYWVSFSYFRQQNYKQSLALVEPLIKAAEAKSHQWLLVRSLYLLAGLQFALNEHSKAISFAGRSLEKAEILDDTVGMVNALTSLIEFHRYLGNYQKSLAYIQQSLPLVNSISLDPIQGCRHFGFEATAFASVGLFAAAAAYQKEALRYAVTSQVDTTMSYNYAFLGMINGKLSNYGDGISNAEQAFNIAAARSTERPYRNLMAYASLQLGDINREAGQFDEGISNYDRAIALYEGLGLPTHLYQAHKGKLLCALAQQNDVLSKSEIALTLSLLEDYRHKISEEGERNSFFDTEQGTYDAAINFEALRMNDAEAAFTYSEASRGRSLLSLMGADALLTRPLEAPSALLPAKPLNLSEILRELPEQVQIVQYSVLSDQLLVWVISKQGMSSRHQAITEEELTRKILDYLKIVTAPPTSSNREELRLSHDLFNLLIKPLEADLGSKQVCIVPDKILNLLPFAALVSPVSGKYLIEDHVLEISPSASVFIRTTETARTKLTRGTEKLLSVGNPSFDPQEFPSLSDLPAAATEAEEVAAAYREPVSFVNEKATLGAVRREMEGSDVIHFALHSDVDERFPLRSKLVFASTGQPAADTLSAYDVYNSKLTRTRLVVLSSCRTAAEQYYRGEGMMSLARSFLVAGVPLVAASLWPVESNSTTELMVRFHRLRTDQLSTVAALRAAQLEMLSDPQSRFHQPYYWAPFVVIGGYAEF